MATSPAAIAMVVFQPRVGIRNPPILDSLLFHRLPGRSTQPSIFEIGDDFKPFAGESGKKLRAKSNFSALLNCAGAKGHSLR
jgi:hypothetical protein